MSEETGVLEEARVGSHRVTHEGGNMAVIYFGGTPDEPQMDQIMSEIIRMRGDAPTFVLIDFSAVDTLPPGARRAVGQRSRELNVQGIAMYGASFHLRVISKLVNGAIAMFKDDPVPQDFFATREEAERWIRDLKDRLAGGEA